MLPRYASRPFSIACLILIPESRDPVWDIQEHGGHLSHLSHFQNKGTALVISGCVGARAEASARIPVPS
jgi:hypothetical protein